MILKFKNSKTKPQIPDSNQDERLFFHDLLNQTHGVLLFLSQKSHEQKGLTSDEVELISIELKKVQMLIKNHNGHCTDVIDVKQFISETQHLIKTFLPEKRFNVLVEINGLDSVTEKTLIPALSWTRIITNIVKNIAEHGAGKTTLTFTFAAHQMKVETENEIADQTARVSGEGLGLTSTRQLSKELGGNFVCAAILGCWRNKFTLPISIEKNAKKSA